MWTQHCPGRLKGRENSMSPAQSTLLICGEGPSFQSVGLTLATALWQKCKHVSKSLIHLSFLSTIQGGQECCGSTSTDAGVEGTVSGCPWSDVQSCRPRQGCWPGPEGGAAAAAAEAGAGTSGSASARCGVGRAGLSGCVGWNRIGGRPFPEPAGGASRGTGACRSGVCDGAGDLVMTGVSYVLVLGGSLAVGAAWARAAALAGSASGGGRGLAGGGL